MCNVCMHSSLVSKVWYVICFFLGFERVCAFCFAVLGLVKLGLVVFCHVMVCFLVWYVCMYVCIYVLYV